MLRRAAVADLVFLVLSRAAATQGKYLASGQLGTNSDVICWDVASKSVMYRLQEHDQGILFVHFTADERFLLTVGKDKKMVVWDMHTGCIVARTACKQAPSCACWGGRARNIKGRETTEYQLATGGEAQRPH